MRLLLLLSLLACGGSDDGCRDRESKDFIRRPAVYWHIDPEDGSIHSSPLPYHPGWMPMNPPGGV